MKNTSLKLITLFIATSIGSSISADENRQFYLRNNTTRPITVEIREKEGIKPEAMLVPQQQSLVSGNITDIKGIRFRGKTVSEQDVTRTISWRDLWRESDQYTKSLIITIEGFDEDTWDFNYIQK